MNIREANNKTDREKKSSVRLCSSRKPVFVARSIPPNIEKIMIIIPMTSFLNMALRMLYEGRLRRPMSYFNLKV